MNQNKLTHTIKVDQFENRNTTKIVCVDEGNNEKRFK